MSRSSPARLRVSVFYTRAAARSFEGLLLPPGITLTPGRPNIGNLLDGFVTSMMDEGDAHGAFVAVCGPVSLSRDVAHTLRAFDVNSKKAVGGIQFHEECVFSASPRITDSRLTNKFSRSLESLDGDCFADS